MRGYAQIRPRSPALDLALTAILFPKHELDGNPYLDPTEELDVVQSRVFITQPYVLKILRPSLFGIFALKDILEVAGQYHLMVIADSYSGR
ncbi:hypothetical protein BDY19DRAFT_991703 [Irpex rosettiformis]|uniref:Uncharacterized protein n=1 Tax=Irpex rosettiformis TaxID=378272 RepID=A0ACB8UA99_9APHY|nr:hypothetical protein BDY19DRAFT_991703 [Irpex rosettiformis]